VTLRRHQRSEVCPPAPVGSMHSGPWFRGLLTRVDIAYAVKSSPGYGTSNGVNLFGSYEHDRSVNANITKPQNGRKRSQETEKADGDSKLLDRARHFVGRHLGRCGRALDRPIRPGDDLRRVPVRLRSLCEEVET
jgi:hypothetical protein